MLREELEQLIVTMMNKMRKVVGMVNAFSVHLSETI